MAGTVLTGPQLREIRVSKGLSQQELAFRAKVNKAYISEYETGVRPEIPEEMLARLERKLFETDPAGRTRARIDHTASGPRLVLKDSDGIDHRPSIASVQWTEKDGTTYRLFLGDRYV